MSAQDSRGMDYLESLPRRWVTLYLPLAAFLFVLLFPFYWMAMTSFKPDAELISREANPFWIRHPTFAHFEKLLLHTSYPDWMWRCGAAASHLLSRLDVEHHHRLGRRDFRLARRERARRQCDRAAALSRLNGHRHGDLPRLPGAALDPLHPARRRRVQDGPVRHALGADPHLPDVPHPVLHLAADGLLPLDPLRARGMRAHRRRDALADPHADHPAARGARAHLRGHLRLHALVERVHLRAHLRVLLGGQDRAGGGGHRAG